MAERAVRIEHVFLPDVDPRDDRLLRMTTCGDRSIGLTIVKRTENTPITETDIESVVVDAEPLFNALMAMLRSEGIKDD